MLAARFMTELIGTFIFLSVIILTTNPLAIVATLLATIIIIGGHFNPAVSTAMWIRGNIGATEYATLIAAQLIGAALPAILVDRHR